MIYFIIFCLTIVSCILFDIIGLPNTVKILMASYRVQMNIMSSKAMSDEEKQRALMKQIPIQLLNLFKLIWGIFFFISPFLILLLLDKYALDLDAEVLYRFKGILVSMIAVVLFILYKKNYANILKGRKNPS